MEKKKRIVSWGLLDKDRCGRGIVDEKCIVNVNGHETVRE